MSNIGRSPSLDRVRFTPLSADPVNPAEGDLQYSDGTARPEGFWVYKNGAWSQVGSATQASSIVTGDDSTAEGSIGAWVTYADAAGTQPVDGTGGSPTVTFTRITSSSDVLNGAASFRLTKDAADRQGEGASLDIDVPNYIRGLPARIRFSAKGSTNFDFGTAFDSADPSDVTVYAYDVTNSKLLQPYPYTIMSNGIAEGMFQIPSDCASLRLILHVTTTNALAYTLDIDDVEISPALDSMIKADSDWEAYTPTITGFTSTSEVNFFCRKNGANLDVVGSFKGGTPSASDRISIGLPTGLTPATVVTSATRSTLILGTAIANVSTTVSTIYASVGMNITYDSNYFPNAVLVVDSTDSDVLATGSILRPDAGNAIHGGANRHITVNFSIPIQGWTSGNRTAASANLNAPVVFSAYKNGGSITADTVIPSWTAVEKDTVSGFNSTTGIYTVKVPGDYLLTANLRTTTGDANDSTLDVYKNNTLYKIGADVHFFGGVCIAIIPDLKVGDTIDLRCQGTRTVSSFNQATRFELTKIETSGRVYSTRVAYLKDVKSSGTNGGTFTSGSYQTRTLNTVEGDSSFVSLSSNQFTLQAGTYRITSSAPASFCDEHKSKLRNITDSSDTLIGTVERVSTSAGGNSDTTRSIIEGTFSITSTKTFEIQHRCTVTRATSGFGVAAGFGDSEVYTTVKIEKVL